MYQPVQWFYLYNENHHISNFYNKYNWRKKCISCWKHLIIFIVSNRNNFKLKDLASVKHILLSVLQQILYKLNYIIYLYIYILRSWMETYMSDFRPNCFCGKIICTEWELSVLGIGWLMIAIALATLPTFLTC